MRIRPESFAFTLLLGALAAIPPLSIDMALPAFPVLEHDLAASSGGAGLTLSLFLAGFACAQLVLGPLSDRYGRRKVLLAGLSLYAVSGALCAASPGITSLIVLRLVQGMCAASGTVMAVAMVRDVFEGAAARTRLSYVSTVLTIAPIIAPTLGSWMLFLAGWRGIFLFLGLAGVALTAAVALLLPETHTPHPAGARPGLLSGFARMLRHRQAIAYAACQGLSFGGSFAFVSGTPLVLLGTLGVSPGTYGLLFAITSSGILIGALTNARLSRRGVRMQVPFAVALCIALLSALAIGAVTWAGALSVAVLMPLAVVHMLCRGLAGPNAAHGALEPMGGNAGAASAVLGFLQMAMGALSSALVAALFPLLGPVAMPLLMSLCAAGALGAWWVAQAPLPAGEVQRH